MLTTGAGSSSCCRLRILRTASLLTVRWFSAVRQASATTSRPWLGTAQIRTDLNLVSHAQRTEQKEIHIRVLTTPVFVLDNL